MITLNELFAKKKPVVKLTGHGTGLLNGKVFVATGELQNYTRKTINETIQLHGGIVGNRVTASTDFVLAGNVTNGVSGNGTMSKKLLDAVKFGIPVISEEEFNGMLAPF